jgi:hypothetical protein
MEAKALFENEMKTQYGINATLADALWFAGILQKGKGRHGINHEYVFHTASS